MAKTISVSNQKIENQGSPKRVNVYLTQAIIHYSCSAEWSGTDTTSDPGVPNTVTGTSYTSHWRVYSTNFTYAWTIGGSTFTGNNTDATVTGLIQGVKNSISGSVIVKSSYIPYSQAYSRSWIDTSYYSPNPDANGKVPGDEGYAGTLVPDGYYTAWVASGSAQAGTAIEVSSTSTACEAIDVWTRPGIFTEYDNFSGGPTGTIIQSASGLTVGKVANWCTHCNKFAHWYNQNNTDTAGSSCQATANGLITAGWYNACIDSISGLTSIEKNNYVDDEDAPGYKVHGGATGTIITVSIINLLGTLISKDDT